MSLRSQCLSLYRPTRLAHDRFHHRFDAGIRYSAGPRPSEAIEVTLRASVRLTKATGFGGN
jgi:hypothetical protein